MTPYYTACITGQQRWVGRGGLLAQWHRSLQRLPVKEKATDQYVDNGYTFYILYLRIYTLHFLVKEMTSTWIMDIHFTFVDMYFTFPRKIYHIFYILHLRICTLHLLVKKMSSDQYADIHYYTGEVNFTTPASGTTCSFYIDL